MATLKTLRQELAKVLGTFASGTATGGSRVTLVDSAGLLDPLASGDSYGSHWLLITSGALAGQVRKVSSYEPTTGTLTVNRAYSPSGPSGGELYELHGSLSPLELADCINRALSRCLYTTTHQITTVAGQREYSLPAWVTDPWQVYSVRKRYGEAANQYYWRDVWFDARVEDGAGVVEVEPRKAGETLTASCLRPYAALALDSDSTGAATELAVAGAKAAAYELLSRLTPGADAAVYRALRQGAAAEFARLARLHQPRPARRVQFEQAY